MVRANFTDGNNYTEAPGLTQWDYGQVLEIHGLDLPKAVEIHFAIYDCPDDAIIRIGNAVDKITRAAIPEKIMEQSQDAVAYVYVSDTQSGETVRTVYMPMIPRQKPEAFDAPEDAELFKETIETVNAAADRAELAKSDAETARDVAQSTADETEAARAEVEALKSQAQTAAESALLSEHNAKASETAAQTAQAGAETAEGQAELFAGQAEENKNFVEAAKAVVMELGQKVADDKSNVEQAVSDFEIARQNAVKEIKVAENAALENIGTGIDDTLTQSGKAAGAKATGDKLDSLKGDLVEYDNGIRRIGNSWRYGSLDSSGNVIEFANKSRTCNSDYFSPNEDIEVTLDDGYSIILCEYNPDKTLNSRDVKVSGIYTLKADKFYRVCIYNYPEQSEQTTPTEFAYHFHYKTNTENRFEEIESNISDNATDIKQLSDSVVMRNYIPKVTYHNDGYVNATTNVITPIGVAAQYFYSDLIEIKKGDVVTVKYKNTLNVVWILSEWKDEVTFASGIVKGNGSESETTYTYTAPRNMYIRHSAKVLNSIFIITVNDSVMDCIKNAIKSDADYSFLVQSFRKIGVVGDSLASGECIADGNVQHDLYEHSWLQYMARAFGFEGINFSKGGMTTRGWLNDSVEYAGMGWTKAQIEGNECNCYIMALGANDMTMINNEKYPLGTPDDIGTDNKTFYAYYSKIISNLKTIRPKAKFFCLTLTWLYTETPPYDTLCVDVSNAIKYIAENIDNCYVIDLDADRWYYGTDNTGNKRIGHYNAIGYNMQAMHLAKLIGNYMHDNQSEFRTLEFIDKDYDYTGN